MSGPLNQRKKKTQNCIKAAAQSKFGKCQSGELCSAYISFEEFKGLIATQRENSGFKVQLPNIYRQAEMIVFMKKQQNNELIVIISSK
jgi:hypothetical protein